MKERETHNLIEDIQRLCLFLSLSVLSRKSQLTGRKLDNLYLKKEHDLGINPS